MGSALRKHLGLARQFVRIGVIRKSQFRVEFLTQVAMDVVWCAAQVLLFEILFLHTPTIAGWSVDEVRVFLGFVFLSDAFLMTWLGQAWHFGRELKDGKLDTVRVRPAATIFLYFFQRFSVEGSVNLALSLGYLAWALAHGGWLVDPLTWLCLPWAITLACWARTVIAVLFSVAEFHATYSDAAHFLDQLLLTPNERPLDVFPRRVRSFLLFAVPVGVISYVPAALVVGRLAPAWGLLHTLWIVAFGLGTFRLWRWSFRRYESAMS